VLAKLVIFCGSPWTTPAPTHADLGMCTEFPVHESMAGSRNPSLQEDIGVQFIEVWF
jgi:hypothetical protein